MFVGFFTKRSDELRLRKDDEFSLVKNVRRCHPATIMLIFMFIFREYHPEPGLFSHDWSRRYRTFASNNLPGKRLGDAGRVLSAGR
jgi:hypothetical protein